MFQSIKRKIILSTIIWTVVSIFFWFAVNQPKEWYWRLFWSVSLILLILVWTKRETLEEEFFQLDLKTRKWQKQLEVNIVQNKLEQIDNIDKQINNKIQDWDLQWVKERRKEKKNILSTHK